MALDSFPLNIQSLAEGIRNGTITPTSLIKEIDRRICSDDDAIWIDRLSATELHTRAAELEELGPKGKPLYGIPFAIKDNIDVAGRMTSAGCPAYAYRALESAPVVEILQAAGAILVGKTNLDQFATGLVGTRSPYGIPQNSFDPQYLPGGSSSGSAVAVAKGLVSFALGTDTAGSGRVPAAFNNIVGLKPSRGLISTRGVVPACRSLDCVSIFALTCDDAAILLDLIAQYDESDPFSRRSPNGCLSNPLPTLERFRFGLPAPDQLEFFGDHSAAAAFDASVDSLLALGGEPIEIDFSPFLKAARLLYQGPWVEERRTAMGSFIDRHPDDVDPNVRKIIVEAPSRSAVDVYSAYYKLMTLRREIEELWPAIDLLLTPTAPTIYTLQQVNNDPLGLNDNLGYYTNFVNLLDLAAVAVPAGFLDNGLPFGITLSAPAFSEARLLGIGDTFHRSAGVSIGALNQSLPAKVWVPPTHPALNKPCAEIAVVGAHLSGMNLNHQLTDLGGMLTRRTRTAARYRLHALPNTQPQKPGLIRHIGAGHQIELEIWQLSYESFGRFISQIPQPLTIGTIDLEDGGQVQGFLCEHYAVEFAPDISSYGGWRAYINAL